jgi:hypothetical protein
MSVLSLNAEIPRTIVRYRLGQRGRFLRSPMRSRLADLSAPAVAQSRGNLLTGAWLSAWTSIADVLYSNHLSFWKSHH